MAESKIQRPVGVFFEAKLLNAEDDLDTVYELGCYSWASTSKPANTPTTKAARMIVFGNNTNNQNMKTQFVADNTGKIFVRIGGNTGWENWFTHSPNAS